MSRVADPMATLALRVVAFHGSARAALLALVGVLVETKERTASLQHLPQEPATFLKLTAISWVILRETSDSCDPHNPESREKRVLKMDGWT